MRIGAGTTRPWPQPAPRVALIVVAPLPGERRKSSSLVVVTRRWRSKWLRAMCMGEAAKCREGRCDHAQGLARGIERCRAVPRADVHGG